MHAVAGHDHVAAHLPTVRAQRPGMVLGHLHPAHGHTRVQVVLAQALARRGVQHAEQRAAVDRQLGPRIAGGQAAGLDPDALAEPVAQHQLAGADGEGLERREQAELGQLSDGVGQEVDADAELGEDRRALQQLDVREAGVVQRHRERQPSDAAPDDDHTHA